MEKPQPPEQTAQKLARPRVEALDELLGVPFQVLDGGFVRLIDYLGDDAAIVQAARVSYGAGTKKVSDDRGLIRYLMRHRHTTPFEMCELKLHVRVPMDAWRQWIRTRTACLAEGTEIWFDLPGGIRRRGNQLCKKRIEDLWRFFQPTRNTQRPDEQRNPYFHRDQTRNRLMRQLDENTLRVRRTRICNVFKSGKKPVFRVTLEDRKSIEATADHRFLFSDGWSTLKERLGLARSGNLAVWRQGDYELLVNGSECARPASYQDREWLDEMYNRRCLRIDDIAEVAGVSYHTIRKWLRVHGVQHAKGGRSHPAWNHGLTYSLGPRDLSDEWIAANQGARSGPASDFWKGGVSTDREGIGRWTSQVASKIHAQNSWTCQLCHQRSHALHCHHVVPVWAAPELARQEGNLTTLCDDCHRNIHGRELEYIEQLGGPPVKAEWVPKPRVGWNRLTYARPARIVNIEYVGEKETYDIEVEGPYHNFVANGIFTHNSVNEYSTRYSIAIDAAQRTDPGAWRRQAEENRQGSAGALDAEAGTQLSRGEAEVQQAARAAYRERLALGVAREQARKDLPLSTYTEAYWKIDLHNLLHFLELRLDARAQLEIRAYAEVIGREIVARWVPLAWEAFQDYRLGATSLSRIETEIAAALGRGEPRAAEAAAAAAGWLPRAADGSLKRHREREECEAKLASLGLVAPWRAPSGSDESPEP